MKDVSSISENGILKISYTRSSKLKKEIKSSVVSYLFLLPFITGTAIFTIYPICMSLLYSFSDFNGAFATQMGIFNFLRIFNTNVGGEFKEIMSSFLITFIYVIVNTSCVMILSYILALFLKRNIKGIGAIRLLCYLPCLIPAIASGIIWRDLFGYNASDSAQYQGLINSAIIKMGLSPLTFFESSKTALATLIFTGFWGIGSGMIMWIASFENISPVLYEAAKIDGAGYFKQLFKITVPLSTPMLFYNLVTSLIAGLQIFVTYANYGTGPDDALNFIAIKIYSLAFVSRSPEYGMASAIAWLLFIIIAVLTLIMFKTGKWVQYGDEND